MSLEKESKTKIHQKQQAITLVQLRQAKLVLAPVISNIRTLDVVPSFVIFAINQGIGNVTAANELSQGALAIAHIMVNLFLLLTLVLRQFKPHISTTETQSSVQDSMSMLYSSSVTAFVLSWSEMKVVVLTMLKS